jgi:IS1 family transposase
VAKKTVMRLLVEAGQVCAEYQDKAFRSLSCKRLQVDELWAFCYCKQKNVTAKIAEKNPEAGDVWLWVAIDAQTKLVPCWMVGPRDSGTATEFIQDIASRMANRIQLTSDGLKVYLEAVEDVFGCDVDFAQLQKIYGTSQEAEHRYSPAKCIGVKGKTIYWQARSKAHLHKLYRTTESFCTYDHEALHKANKRLQ